MRLKPCPFCGSDTVNDTSPPEHPCFWWVCPDCVAVGPVGNSVLSATEAWNRRSELSPWISVDELPTESGYFLTRNPDEMTIAGPRMNKYIKGSGWVFSFGFHTEYMPIPD